MLPVSIGSAASPFNPWRSSEWALLLQLQKKNGSLKCVWDSLSVRVSSSMSQALVSLTSTGRWSWPSVLKALTVLAVRCKTHRETSQKLLWDEVCNGKGGDPCLLEVGVDKGFTQEENLGGFWVINIIRTNDHGESKRNFGWRKQNGPRAENSLMCLQVWCTAKFGMTDQWVSWKVVSRSRYWKRGVAQKVQWGRQEALSSWLLKRGLHRVWGLGSWATRSSRHGD